MMAANQATEKVTKNPVKGKVVALSKDGKTIKLEVQTVVAHKLYNKRLRRDIGLYADTAGKTLAVGNTVFVLPARRYSKTKSWKVVSVQA